MCSNLSVMSGVIVRSITIFKVARPAHTMACNRSTDICSETTRLQNHVAPTVREAKSTCEKFHRDRKLNLTCLNREQEMLGVKSCIKIKRLSAVKISCS